jgi:hypothetical protein
MLRLMLAIPILATSLLDSHSEKIHSDYATHVPEHPI